MTEKKAHGDAFWECPTCRAELWEYDEKTERQIRKAMQSAPARKKSSGSRRKSRYKMRKPGQKFVPWYQRF
ncbi:MAG: hypothetical protein K6U04_06800 [Armatimonadetes bacterium]|nr:hypothetical protein [Armatimonadota bacterium]